MFHASVRHGISGSKLITSRERTSFEGTDNRLTGQEIHWLERILTMVYVVQSYWACFGLYPSSCMW
jgi:hypothetical protein